jgi:hypothetical protein
MAMFETVYAKAERRQQAAPLTVRFFSVLVSKAIWEGGGRGAIVKE